MMKKLGVLAFLALLSACAGHGDQNTARGQKADEVPLTVSWGQDGYGDGFIVKPVPGAVGQFRIRVYYRDPLSTSSTGVVNRCFGHWDTQSMDGDTGKSELDGYWRINCASGLRAEGAFLADDAGNGVGEGLDAQGHPVRVYFGQNASQPTQD
ncbi:hypothetical protein EOI86_00400 [Hwanghaeella grinnelliae]|uniref:Lipoprotein n=1 Tax=Hwanghaeella grinnelliae TaxID=2500179 RepID=A0A3S2Z8I0_9PROT|nr:hypothetical protein [Hwanghaeella grinnelliae]RVU37801.1 hypothetical protein EOI86_00400 [Hwanghaeella grinnelliae]